MGLPGEHFCVKGGGQIGAQWLVSSKHSDEDGRAQTFPPQHRLPRGAQNCLLILEPFSVLEAVAVKELNKEQRGRWLGSVCHRGRGE